MLVPTARDLARRLAAVPSLLYGALYLLTWLLSAGLYSFMSPHFYHATVKLESPSRALRSQLLYYFDHMLNRSVARHAVHHLGRNWQFHAGNIHVTHVDTENDRLLVRVAVVVTSSSSSAIAILQPTLRCRHVWSLPTTQQHVYAVAIDATANQEFLDQNGITGDQIRTALLGAWLEGEAGVYVDDAQHEAVEQLAAWGRGTSTPSVDTFLRMLYFSAITITTVGYGDVLPITTVARFCVSLEAVAGIVLIGLFLNSIAHEASRTD